jgi:hypothetical protein
MGVKHGFSLRGESRLKLCVNRMLRKILGLGGTFMEIAINM